MIRVITMGEKDQITRIAISGHAQTAPAGQDIVCAAVSAIAQTCMTAVLDMSGLGKVTVGENGGHLDLQITEKHVQPWDAKAFFEQLKAFNKAQLIIQVLLKGLHMIDEAHPGCLTFGEVK